MNYEYKFLRFRSKDTSPEKIQEELNKLGAEGWKILNFHPTSDGQLRDAMWYAAVPNDWGYVFVLSREIS